MQMLKTMNRPSPRVVWGGRDLSLAGAVAFGGLLGTGAASLASGLKVLVGVAGQIGGLAGAVAFAILLGVADAVAGLSSGQELAVDRIDEVAGACRAFFQSFLLTRLGLGLVGDQKILNGLTRQIDLAGAVPFGGLIGTFAGLISRENQSGAAQKNNHNHSNGSLH
ncbi:MAG: hypothetical protein U5J82_04240 [Desulfobacterales bacterium]|nr:hypothetical protein [Desulfobacterales bacterium]